MFVNYLLIMLASSKFIVGFIMRTLNFHKCDKIGLLFEINIHHATLYMSHFAYACKMEFPA